MASLSVPELVHTVLKYLNEEVRLFIINDEFTRTVVENTVSDNLKKMFEYRKLTYTVICNETNNTKAAINANALCLEVFWRFPEINNATHSIFHIENGKIYEEYVYA